MAGVGARSGALLAAVLWTGPGAAQEVPAGPPASPSPAASSPPASPSPSPSPLPSPAVTTGLSALPAGRAAALEGVVLAAMARHGIPGLSAAVVVEREPRWSAGFGLADVENLLPASPATVYRLASVSKPITAVAVLQLARRGQLDLDAPIQRYVAGFPSKPWPVTARQLLAHQAGVRNWTREEFHNTRRFRSVGESLFAFAEDDLLFEPGTRFHYTSYGYTLLGAAVEGVAGAPFSEVLRANVFEPAGMASAREDSVLAIVPRRARGYQRSAAGVLLNAPLSDTSNRLPGGGLLASAEDVARFASALLKGTLLDAEGLRLAFTPQALRTGAPTNYGLGFVVGRTGGRREAWHTGGQPQVSTVLYMLPEAGVAVVLLAALEGVGEAAMLELARALATLAAR